MPSIVGDDCHNSLSSKAVANCDSIKRQLFRMMDPLDVPCRG